MVVCTEPELYTDKSILCNCRVLQRHARALLPERKSCPSGWTPCHCHQSVLVISKSGINRCHDSSRHSEVSVESHSCLTAASGPFSPPLVTSSQQHGVCWHRAGAGAVLSREDNPGKECMNLTALTPCPSEVHWDVLLTVRSSPVLMQYLQQH